MEAYDVGKWILVKNPTLRHGCYDGNVKLNKLLYFSNLMYFAVHNKNLITDTSFERWDNGPVIRKVYTQYKYYNCEDINLREEIKFDEEINKILNIINFVYSDKTAKELSEETHKHDLWIYTKKNKDIIFSKIGNEEARMMRKIYDVYKDFDFEDLEFDIINGIKYYYFKSQFEMTDEIIKQLENNYSIEKSVFLEMIDGELVFS